MDSLNGPVRGIRANVNSQQSRIDRDNASEVALRSPWCGT